MMYYNQLETGKRIQKLRRECYLTQEELAIKLNISDRHLRNLERGEYAPSIDLFVEIAAFFDVTLDYLIIGKVLSDHEEHLRNKLQQKRLANQKLSQKSSIFHHFFEKRVFRKNDVFASKPEGMLPVLQEQKAEARHPKKTFSFQIHYGHSKGNTPNEGGSPKL